MGKQINYYMGYHDFIKLTQFALDCGCVILKKENDTLIRSNNLNCITDDDWIYFFAIPQTDLDPHKSLGLLSYDGKIIEAGFSKIIHKDKYITRARIYVGSGMYTPDGEYIPRSDDITKLYNKLSRTAKKLAPYIEINDTFSETTEGGHLCEKTYDHKEYISSECFELWKNSGFKLR